MKNTVIKFCKVVMHCQQHYSENITAKLASIIHSQEAVIKLYNIIQTNPTEQEFIKILDNEFPMSK